MMSRLKETVGELIKEAVRQEPHERKRRDKADKVRQHLDPSFQERHRERR
jgi:hypothetical protein